MGFNSAFKGLVKENQEKRDAIVGPGAQILMRGSNFNAGHPQHEGDLSPKFNIICPALSLEQSKQHRITRPVCLYDVLETHAHTHTHTHARARC